MSEPDAKTVLMARVQERLEATGLNPYSASMKAGLGPDYVRNILRSRIKNPSADKLARLAESLDTSVRYLLGAETELDKNYVSTRAEPHILTVNEVPDVYARSDGAVEVKALALPIRFELFADAWRPAHSVSRKPLGMEVAPDLPAFRGREQWYEIIRDDSMIEVAPRGCLVHVVEFNDEDRESLEDGELVIVQRRMVGPDASFHLLHRSMRVANYRYPDLGLWFLDYMSDDQDENETDDILKDWSVRLAQAKRAAREGDSVKSELSPEVERALEALRKTTADELEVAVEAHQRTKAKVVAKVLRIVRPCDPRAVFGMYSRTR